MTEREFGTLALSRVTSGELESLEVKFMHALTVRDIYTQDLMTVFAVLHYRGFDKVMTASKS